MNTGPSNPFGGYNSLWNPMGGSGGQTGQTPQNPLNRGQNRPQPGRINTAPTNNITNTNIMKPMGMMNMNPMMGGGMNRPKPSMGGGLAMPQRPQTQFSQLDPSSFNPQSWGNTIPAPTGPISLPPNFNAPQGSAAFRGGPMIQTGPSNPMMNQNPMMNGSPYMSGGGFTGNSMPPAPYSNEQSSAPIDMNPNQNMFGSGRRGMFG